MAHLSLDTLRQYILLNLSRREAFLLPMRLFIALGWLRAGVEKIIEPAWHNGDALTLFLREQMSNDAVYFPIYHSLIHDLFLPNAAVLSWIIIIGQLLVGVAVMAGMLTNLALLGGLFMNLNFILVGQVNPSAFYVIMQGALFLGNIGAIMGADAYLAQKIPTMFVAAQPSPYTLRPGERTAFLWLSILIVGVALLSIPFVRDYGPHSVDDPAMLLFILSLLGAMSCMILVLQQPVPVTRRKSVPVTD